MRRFFVEDIKPEQTSVEVSGDEFTHLKKVLRLSVGSNAAIFNGAGLELKGTIESIGKSSASVLITSSSVNSQEDALKIVLLQGLLKGEKSELVIQKATELGVSKIIFYGADRSVMVISEEKIDARAARWKKTAIEAAKQCGRTVVPEILIREYDKALLTNPDFARLIIWENEKKMSLNTALSSLMSAQGIVALIGPEGGLTEVEVAKAREQGYVCASLGSRILRAETAAIAVVAMLRFAFDETNPS